MYLPDSGLRVPADDARIWRYLDFTKFVALLSGSSLHFSRADTFLDRFEVSIPLRDLAAARAWTIGQIHRGSISRDGITRYLSAVSGQPASAFLTLSEHELAVQFLRHANSALFVSCWHMNQDESAAMWDLYLGNGPGVAIESSFAALRDELDRATGDTMVAVGSVDYLDYQSDSWGPYRPFNAVFHKRRSFDHERELRAVIVRPTYEELGRDGIAVSAWPDIDVPVQLSRLVHRVWISPRSAPWFAQLVATVSERLGSPLPLVRSNLYDAPDFS